MAHTKFPVNKGVGPADDLAQVEDKFNNFGGSDPAGTAPDMNSGIKLNQGLKQDAARPKSEQ